MKPLIWIPAFALLVLSVATNARVITQADVPADTVATGIRIGRYEMDLWKMDISGRIEFLCSRIGVAREGAVWRMRAEHAGSAVGGAGRKQTFESF